MEKMKLKKIVKMGKEDNFMYNYDVDYNDDECEYHINIFVIIYYNRQNQICITTVERKSLEMIIM